MKTNKITLMIMGLAVASLFASCKKNDNNAVVGEGFRAFTEQGGNGSRTHGVADGNTIAVQWTSGDQILVANQGGTGSQLTYNLKSGANSTEGSFANTNESSDFLQPDYVAIYPATNAAGVANSISGTTATFNLPATQTYLEGSFAEKSMPMVAYSGEQELQFNNVLGGLCFPVVGNTKVTKVEVISTDANEALWGTCMTTISATDDPTSTVSNTEANKNVITLDCGSGIVLDGTTATDFYVMVPAGTLESGFTVKAYNGSDVIYEKSTPNAPGANFIPRSVVRKVNSNLTIAFAVTTISPTYITTNSAKAIGRLDRGLDVKGILYANIDELEGNPEALVVGGSGVHQLTSSVNDLSYEIDLTGLVEDKLYFVRAYAVSDVGTTIYGEVIPFATRYDYYSSTNKGKSREVFSVAANKTVRFSMGNLQYIGSAATPYWKFADYQFDYFCDNGQGSTNTNVDRDYFGWGTSGYHNTSDQYNVNYYPYCISMSEVSQEYNKYGYGPSINMPSPNLTGTSANYDWGVYNAIRNGGQQAGLWRTPQGHNSDDNTYEWHYLLAERSGDKYANVQLVVRGDASGVVENLSYCGTAINGVLVFPDNFSWPTYVSISAIGTKNAPTDWSNNRLTEAQWSLLEQAGAIFLPAAGLRQGDYIYLYELGAFYWSATYFGYETSGALVTPERRSWYAYYWEIGSTSIYTRVPNYRYDGMSVRLVCDAN